MLLKFDLKISLLFQGIEPGLRELAINSATHYFTMGRALMSYTCKNPSRLEALGERSHCVVTQQCEMVTLQTKAAGVTDQQGTCITLAQIGHRRVLLGPQSVASIPICDSWCNAVGATMWLSGCR